MHLYVYNQHGFVERNKVCGRVSSPQVQPCTCVCTLKANLGSLTCLIESWFCSSDVITAQTVPVHKVNPLLCSEVLELCILNAVISPSGITALISLLLHIQMIFSFTSGVSSSPFPARKELVQSCTGSWSLTDCLDYLQLTRPFL